MFILIGMHRSDVRETARKWHTGGTATGLAARISTARWLDRLPGMESAFGRFVLVAAFMGAVAVPLTTSLSEFVRESQIGAAVSALEAEIEDAEDAFVIEQETRTEEDGAIVRLRVATRQWITAEREAELQAVLSERAQEPITLTIEQLLASSGDLEAFAEALPSRPSVRTAPVATPETVPATVAGLRGRLVGVLEGLSLPDSVRIVGGALEVETIDDGPVLEVAYAAARRLPIEAEAMIAGQAARALDLDPGAARTVAIRLGTRALPDSSTVGGLAAALSRYPRLRLTVAGDTLSVRQSRQLLVSRGAPPGHVLARPDTLPPRARLTLAPDSTLRR